MAAVFSEMVYQVFVVHRDRALKDAVSGNLVAGTLGSATHLMLPLRHLPLASYFFLFLQGG